MLCTGAAQVAQLLNGVIYSLFASGLLPMPAEMMFHWNTSAVLQRGVVRPIRRPVSGSMASLTSLCSVLVLVAMPPVFDCSVSCCRGVPA